MADIPLTPEVRAVLEQSTITLIHLKLPPVRLDRPLYLAVNKALEAAGGKWERATQSHAFNGDPRAKLGLMLETGIAGDEQKKFQAFYTPPELAAQVAELAQVSGHCVLEPSAGRGALVKECLALGASAVDCIELNPENLNPLRDHHTVEKPVSVHIGDFLEFTSMNCVANSDPSAGAFQYDRIVMNPPFTRDQDIAHVTHALKFLAPGGILVSIMLDNMERPKFQKLTSQLSGKASYSFVKVPEKTFKDTPVRTVILKIKSNPAAVVDTTPAQPVTSHEPSLPTAMKLTIPRTTLVAALAAVKSAAAASSTLPILANVLLVANEGNKAGIGSATLTGCDLDLTLRQRVDATVTTPGKTTVRAGLLHDIARSADGEQVSLQLVKDTLHVECGTVKFKLSTLDPEEFPPMPRVKNPNEFTLEEAALRSMLARTVFATSTDEQRPVFNGSLIQVNGELNIAACDGRRLGLVTTALPDDYDDSLDKLNLILPAKAVRELLRLLSAKEEESKVAIAAGLNLVSFTFGETTLVTKLIEGDYPDYRRIIPQSEQPIASIQRADLLRAVERVALVSDAIRLEFGKHSLAIESSRLGEKKELLGEASDNLLCAASQELVVVLGTRYLREALTATAAEEVQFFAANNVAMFKSPAENWLAVIAGMSDKAPEAAPATKPATPAKK